MNNKLQNKFTCNTGPGPIQISDTEVYDIAMQLPLFSETNWVYCILQDALVRHDVLQSVGKLLITRKTDPVIIGHAACFIKNLSYSKSVRVRAKFFQDHLYF